MTLKEMRRAASLTQVNAAAAMGVSQAALGAWERGEARPTLDKLKPMAGLYGVSLEALVDAITGEGRETHGDRLQQPGPGVQGGGRPYAD